MKMSGSALKVLLCIVGLAIAFWSGRASSTTDDENSDKQVSARSQEPRPTRIRRGARRNHTPPAGIVTPGAGQNAAKSVAQLQEIIKGQGSMAVGKLQIALSQMNSKELENLAIDLSEQQAMSPNTNQYYQVAQQLFSRWADVDPEAALRFASKTDQVIKNTALPAVFYRLAYADPSYAMEEVKRIQNPQLAQRIRSTVLHVMAEKTPELWLNLILSDPELSRSANIYNVVVKWVKDDPSSALTRINKLPPHLQLQAVPYVAREWAQTDPAAALAWAQSLKNKGQSQQAVSSIIGIVAVKDPDSAMDIINGMPAGMRMTGLGQLYGAMANKDVQGALDKALALTNTGDRHNALKAIIGNSYGRHGSGWGSHYYGSTPRLSPEQIKSLTDQLPIGELRDNALAQMAGHLKGVSESKVEELLAGYSDKDRTQVLSGLMNTITSTDPKRALEIYQKLPAGMLRNYQYASLLGQLANTDPAEAMQLALGGKTEEHLTENINSVISAVSQKDPAAAARLIESIEGEKVRQQVISTAASLWGRNDPDAAIAWAHQLPTEEKQVALATILPSMAANDPERASQLFDGYTRTGAINESQMRSAASNIASTWSNIDPEATAIWATKLPVGKIQSAAVGSIVTRWAVRDLDQAGQWIDTFPDGATRDAGVRSLVSAVKERDSANAFNWANTISNNDQRLSALNNVVYTWKRRDPEKA